ncbi:hypothetical protein ACHHYP_10372 [Achlya hypogyna]|uniref:No apical meristem-associated C-terminal domain-containing protein n=1 Tax=Achlya hypogyna TaxID=1202772 RepID=A0A1V9YLL9_ACHHY|nr:hypothetical protein ACHHYP_10372 [Achlya hypogyna]
MEAVVIVSTDPAVGTDQSGAVYWEKVHHHYKTKIPSSTRSVTALQARWDNPLQKHINKSVGILSSVLREYHSGWQLQDYMLHAKTKFQETNKGKPFKFESLYLIVKNLPKYSIDIHTVDSKVKTALGLDADTGDNGNISLDTAPRPTVGKKKAKGIKMERDYSDAKRPKLIAASESLHRISEADEAKYKLLKDAMMVSFFSSCPDGPQKTKFFALMAEKFIREIDSNQGELQIMTKPEISDEVESLANNTQSDAQSTPELDNVAIV